MCSMWLCKPAQPSVGSRAACCHGQTLAPARTPPLQEHIEMENRRLEEEGQFWAKEIVVRIEYRFCPNLTIIDTPGEDAPPCAAGCSTLAGAIARAPGNRCAGLKR